MFLSNNDFRAYFSIFLAILLSCSFAQRSVQAVPLASYYLVVDTTADNPTLTACTLAINDCSLRGAITYANAATIGSEIQITIPAGTYNLTETGAGDNVNLTGDLDVTRNIVTLTGSGQDQTILDGQASDRVIDNLGGTLTVENLTIRGGSVVTGENGGGGIINHGGRTMLVYSVHVLNNSVSGVSQYIDNGGGIANYGHMTVQASQINNNIACNGGGVNSSNAWLILDHVSISDNQVLSDTGCGNGGGLATTNGGSQFEIFNVEIMGNTGVRGGGVFYNVNDGEITDSYIHDNIATTNGGGLYNYGTLILERVTLEDNQASGNGGGIGNSEILTLLNVTIGNNSAINGGGIYNTGSSTITMDHCTIAGNTASVAGTAYYGWTGSGTTLHNTILAGAIPGKTWGTSGIAAMTNQGYNLCSDTSCPLSIDFHDLINVDPQLQLMGHYGGANPTMPLMPISPAIDAADPVITLETDQRGFPRADGNRDDITIADIGAFEYSPAIWFPLILRTP